MLSLPSVEGFTGRKPGPKQQQLTKELNKTKQPKTANRSSKAAKQQQHRIQTKAATEQEDNSSKAPKRKQGQKDPSALTHGQTLQYSKDTGKNRTAAAGKPKQPTTTEQQQQKD
ncbi:hypothetical protein LXL04_003594 [Taraxacum kok-saghyz]